MHLLDVNVLIALGDPFHIHHQAAVRSFLKLQPNGWATCPLTEDGFVRIVGLPNYPEGPGTTDRAALLLRQMLALPGHSFWPDGVSLLDAKRFANLPPSRQLTDLYLLALAVHHGGKLVTFDQRIDPALTPGGAKALMLLSHA